MKFKMNGIEYTIKEVSQEQMFNWHKDREEDGYYFGQTHFASQEVWLSNELSTEKKKMTLYHELMHCYIKEYITNEDNNFPEEVMCDISAKSHDIIHEIVNKYFNLPKKEKHGIL